MESHDIVGLFIVLGTAVILPITIIFLALRGKMASERNRKEIILAALEKNADIDIEELVRKMNKPEELLKEKLLKKLQWGTLAFILGVGMIGLVLLAVGIAFLANYQIGKKMLAKEMEAEERNLRQA